MYNLGNYTPLGGPGLEYKPHFLSKNQSVLTLIYRMIEKLSTLFSGKGYLISLASEHEEKMRACGSHKSQATLVPHGSLIINFNQNDNFLCEKKWKNGLELILVADCYKLCRIQTIFNFYL